MNGLRLGFSDWYATCFIGSQLIYKSDDLTYQLHCFTSHLRAFRALQSALSEALLAQFGKKEKPIPMITVIISSLLLIALGLDEIVLPKEY